MPRTFSAITHTKVESDKRTPARRAAVGLLKPRQSTPILTALLFPAPVFVSLEDGLIQNGASILVIDIADAEAQRGTKEGGKKRREPRLVLCKLDT